MPLQSSFAQVEEQWDKDLVAYHGQLLNITNNISLHLEDENS